MAGSRWQLTLFDTGGVWFRRLACTPSAHRVCFPQGMRKVVCLPMGPRPQIRDGPLQRPHRLGRLRKDITREAA